MKVNKPKRSMGKLVPDNPSSRLKAVLPVLLMLENIFNHTPNEIMDILSHITDKNSHRMLTPVQKLVLSAYLEKYGYNSYWMKEDKNEDIKI